MQPTTASAARHLRRRTYDRPRVVDDLELLRTVGEERPDEPTLVYSIHDGGKIPAGLLRDGEAALMERADVRRAFHNERDWGANLIARHLARALGAGGFVRLELARLALDFGRLPGCTPAAAPHLARRSIFPPLQGLLSPETRHALLTRAYDPVDRELTRRFRGKTLMISVHTYDARECNPVFRPEVSLITGSPESEARHQGAVTRFPEHHYDPLFPLHLCEDACDPLLACRMAFDVERSGFLASMNTPYAMPPGCVEIRAQVRFFFRYLRRRFVAENPATADRPAHRQVWRMLLDVTRRSPDTMILQDHLHRRGQVPPGRELQFAAARRAYREIARFAATHRGDLLRGYRFSGERPSTLAVEVRKDLICRFDRRGYALDLRCDADDVARDVARQLAAAVSSYLGTVLPGRPASHARRPARAA